MLTQKDLTRLLDGSLTDEAATEILLQLEPENVKADQFADLVQSLAQTAEPQFAALERFGHDAIDCCGTGGSGRQRFNTSTAVAFVLAAAGVRVVKFGNRAASSKSGSFDVLNRLGIPATVAPDKAARLLEECNLAFLFAPQVYPALARLAPIRKAIGKKTVLNFVGPLLNPARPVFRLVGVSDAHMLSLIASRLAKDPRNRLSLVVRSSCGLDEICPDCQTHIEVVGAGSAAADLEAARAKGGNGSCTSESINAIPAPTPEINARTMLQLFDGQQVGTGAYELVALNAAASLVTCGQSISLAAAQDLVRELLSAGKVKAQYNKVIACYAKS